VRNARVLLLLVIAISSFVIWQFRQRRGRRHLAEIEQGDRCVSCNGTSLAVEENKARCLNCGHEVSLEWLRGSSVDAKDIAALTRPDGKTNL
jgi:hypothetical protein